MSPTPLFASIIGPATRAAEPPQLHAPDGLLTPLVALAFWVVTAVVVGLCVRQANRTLDERAVPLMGVMAAFIFAAQMFNFPVVGGTSGHLLGGVLAAVLLGPWAGTLVMTCVVAVQALVFQDGGLLVLGANIFNMGIVGTFGGYWLYRAIARLLGGEQRGRLPAAAIAAWVAVMTGSLTMTLQLVASDATAIQVALPAMLGVHALIGVGEALITTAALAFIAVTRSDLLTVGRRRADSRAAAGTFGAGVSA